ncbi:MAG: hypothetical protein AABY22_07000 [Nanoarchaeota archaeon]
MKQQKINLNSPNILYPIWIISDRYGGVYSGYEWIAGAGSQLLTEILSGNYGILASDTETWDKPLIDMYPFMSGGNTPNDALINLNTKVVNLKLPKRFNIDFFQEKLTPEIFFEKKIKHINDRWWKESYVWNLTL